MQDRHNLVFAALFCTAISVPLPLGHSTPVSDVPNVVPVTRIAGGESLHSWALEHVDEIINFNASPVLGQKAIAVRTGVTIVGVASTYNPYRPGRLEGGKKTASGEPYDPIKWTAAIQIDLREKFGGVGYGRQYRPAYALVEGVNKKAIIKINDVGQLRPGRVIDLNEQTMRYFDPTLKLGLIRGVRITPLVGDKWAAGPVEQASFSVSMK